jgi:hypothetical protein
MTKSIVIVLAMALVPACAFAVDGVVLINQSTVMSSGGFPYHITQTGSYRLSGNLVATRDQQAILINANNVTLDMNGFNVSCNFEASLPPGGTFSCIGDPGDSGSVGGVSDLSIRNGTVTVTSEVGVDTVAFLFAVGFYQSATLIVEDLHIEFSATTANTKVALVPPAHSIIRHNVLEGNSPVQGIYRQCPSVFEGNINTTGGGGGTGSGCVYRDNIGPF